MTFNPQDHFFKKAKSESYFARSVYKLKEIDEKYKILKKNDRVLDLGYHPGSWVQYASERIGPQGQVVGLDLRPVRRSLCAEGHIFLYQKDIFDIQAPTDIDKQWTEKFDVLLSDMAPNTTGIKSLDQTRSLLLVEKIFDFIPIVLKKSGHLVIKVFDSHDAQVLLKEKKNLFDQFYFLKPKSTRSISKEFFVIGKNFRS